MHRNIRVRLGILFLEKFAEAAIFPFIALKFANTLGPGPAGMMMLAAMLTATLAGLQAGHLADARGRRAVLVPVEAIRFLAVVGLAVANVPGLDLVWLSFAFFVVVAGAAGMSAPISEALVIDVANDANRRRIYGWVYWMTNLARSTGTLAGAFLYTAHFFELTVLVAAVSAVVAGVVVLFLAETRPGGSAAPAPFRPTEMAAGFAAVLRDRLFFRYVLAGVLSLGVAAQLSHYVAVRLGLEFEPETLFALAGWVPTVNGPELFGLLRIENAVLVILFAGLVQRLVRGARDETLWVWGFSLFAIGFAVLAVAGDAWILISFTAVFTIGELLYAPPQMALLARLAREDARSRYAAVHVLSFRVALMLGALGIAVVGTVPPWTMAVVFVAASIVVVVLLVSVARGLERRVAARPVSLDTDIEGKEHHA